MFITRFGVGVLTVALLTNLLLAGAVNVREAHACSCAGTSSTEESFREADAVFSGEVVDIGRLPAPPSGTTTLTMPYLDPVTFDVGEAWKGVSKNPVVVHGQGPEASCGIDFEVGETYLVFAYHSGETEDSLLQTDFCGPTVQADEVTARQMLGHPRDSLPETGGISPERPEPRAGETYVIAATAILTGLAAGVLLARPTARGRRR